MNGAFGLVNGGNGGWEFEVGNWELKIRHKQSKISIQLPIRNKVMYFQNGDSPKT
jgi:hypothetical protein